MFGRWLRRRWSAAGLGLAALVGLSGCELPGFDSPEGATRQGRDIFGLWQGSVVAALAVGAVVWALIFFAVIRYRRRRRADDAIPSQRQYNLGLEVFYTLVPLVIVAVLFYFTVTTQQEVTEISSDPAVRVEVTAFQWGWEFHYLGSEVVVATQGAERPTLTLPLGQTTRITLMSADVVHDFFVPDFLYKRDAVPGMVQTFDLDPVRTGTFLGRCAEFCGLLHGRMLFEVSVVSPADFQRWLAERRPTPTAPPPGSEAVAPAPGGAGGPQPGGP